MDQSNPGKRPLAYAAEITVDDVRALDSFIRRRITEASSASRGSHERQLSRSIKGVLLLTVGTLENVLPLDVHAQKGLAPQKTPYSEIRVAWNALWSLSAPWQGHEEYDQKRWRHVKYWNTDHECSILDQLPQSPPQEEKS